MKDPTVEYIDTISDFFNQRAIVKSMGYLYKFTYINWFYTHKALYQTVGRLLYEIDAT